MDLLNFILKLTFQIALNFLDWNQSFGQKIRWQNRLKSLKLSFIWCNLIENWPSGQPQVEI